MGETMGELFSVRASDSTDLTSDTGFLHLAVVSAARQLLFFHQPMAGRPPCGVLPLSIFSPTGVECHSPAHRNPACVLPPIFALFCVSPITPQRCALPQGNGDFLCLIDQSCLNVIPLPL